MRKILKEYIDFIRSFENSIKLRYDTKKNPCEVAGFLFDRIGTINQIKYRFHGTGCTAEKDGIIYAYDISIFENDEIQFSLWEFSEFIRTHPVYNKLNYTQEFIEKELSKLIDEQVLAWLIIMGRIYKTYRFLNI